MNKLATTSLAAAVMLTGVAGAATTSDAAGPAASGRTQHVTRLVIHQVESHPASDNHPVGVDRLRSLATHKIVGYDNFSGVFNPKNDDLRFWLSISLKGGLIDSVFNTNTSEKSFTGKITQGYGRYRNIAGTIHVRISDSGRAVYTLRYTL